MKLKVGDRVKVYDYRQVELRRGAKGTVASLQAPFWVGVDLDNGMLTTWFVGGQCKKLRKKK